MAFTYQLKGMLRKFGVVTVMNVEAYETVMTDGEWDSAATLVSDKKRFTLDTLKIANINQEGPTKSITGGQNADVLLKYGKTMSIEMQDALGKYDVLEHVYGVNFSGNDQIASVTDRFPGELTLVGTTFVIDQATGAKQPIHIVIPRFLGDGIFNLTQDAEGDATVFDLNGNILKFNGGFASETPAGEEDDAHYYGTGADGEFYFLCTEQILEEIKTQGYEAAWAAEAPTA